MTVNDGKGTPDKERLHKELRSYGYDPEKVGDKGWRLAMDCMAKEYEKLLATVRAEAIKEVLGSEEIKSLIKIVDDLDYVFTNIGHPSLKGIYTEFSPRCKVFLDAFNKRWSK